MEAKEAASRIQSPYPRNEGSMARKIFFSFHYERDAWRAGQVRNCNVVSSEDQYGFVDAAEWESIKKKGESEIQRWIANQLKNTSVTAVLIGAETADREWVQHEIVQSWNRGNGIVGIRIHNIKDQDQETDVAGRNPFDSFKLPDGTLLSAICKTYDWVIDDGRKNLGTWADEAAAIRAKFGANDEIVGVAERSQQTGKVRVVSAASVGFAPRSPWSSNYVDRKR
jgi:hypothetical protein